MILIPHLEKPVPTMTSSKLPQPSLGTEFLAAKPPRGVWSKEGPRARWWGQTLENMRKQCTVANDPFIVDLPIEHNLKLVIFFS